jgi:excisionase family DNA binding protein
MGVHSTPFNTEPNGMEKKTMTITEAAKVLGIGRNNAYAAARNGDIPTIKIGKRILVP